MKTALVTGIGGQDGYFLTAFLLEKGYEVHGLVRRVSSGEPRHLSTVKDKLVLHVGDLMERGSVARLFKSVKFDEVYNLAAMSFVKASFEVPEYTGDVDGLAVIRILEEIRNADHPIRLYQASTSEMFGSSPAPQNELTPFRPRSPYGCAKLYAHSSCVNYREAYGLHVSCGILYNHECVTAETPIIIRTKDGLLDCAPMEDIILNPAHAPQRLLDFDVWDRGKFVRALSSSTTFNGRGRNRDRRVHRIIARSGEVRASADHVFLREDTSDVRCEELQPGDRLLTTSFPEPPCKTLVTKEWARLLGLFCADGCVSLSEGYYSASYRKNSEALRGEVTRLWVAATAGRVSEMPGVSGFSGKLTGGLNLMGESAFIEYIHSIVYTSSGHKRVPRVILNSDSATWLEFLRGYNDGDGLKAGYGDREFKNFKTSSPTLAAGLWWLASSVLKQRLVLNVDFVVDEADPNGGMRAYYSINLNAEDNGGGKGKHLIKPQNEIKRVIPETYRGWLYDIETESGTFHAGPGNLVIHNSPRRGAEFVTQKIVNGVARISLGLQRELRLGNMDAKRDWGHARDFVEAMWLMVQRPEPDDYVIATGVAHTIGQFADAAFSHVGLSWRDYVKIDETFMRPSDVHDLCGDASKARAILGWQPKISFKELVEEMVEAAIVRAKLEVVEEGV